jgi:transposase
VGSALLRAQHDLICDFGKDMDLGVGLSTLRRWLDKRREREIEAPPPERQDDLAAELKRLPRENEILRQEREILKRAATFFAKEGSR